MTLGEASQHEVSSDWNSYLVLERCGDQCLEQVICHPNSVGHPAPPPFPITGKTVAGICGKRGRYWYFKPFHCTQTKFFSSLYQNMPLSRKMCRLNIDDVLKVFFPLYKTIFCLGIHKTVILIRISEPSYSVFKNNSFWYSSWQFYLHTIFMMLNYIRIIVVLGFKMYNV